jgi:hypothetical protein
VSLVLGCLLCFFNLWSALQDDLLIILYRFSHCSFIYKAGMENNGVASWARVNTICLREMCANNTIPSRVFEFDDDFIRIYAVGQNCEFVLLEKDDGVYMFDLNLKEAKKVYLFFEFKGAKSFAPFIN